MRAQNDCKDVLHTIQSLNIEKKNRNYVRAHTRKYLRILHILHVCACEHALSLVPIFNSEA